MFIPKIESIIQSSIATKERLLSDKSLLNTIKSRSLEMKIILSEAQRIRIINELLKLHDIKFILDPEKSRLSPGNFLKFNYIFNEYDISIDDNFLNNLSLLLNLHKKNKGK